MTYVHLKGLRAGEEAVAPANPHLLEFNALLAQVLQLPPRGVVNPDPSVEWTAMHSRPHPQIVVGPNLLLWSPFQIELVVSIHPPIGRVRRRDSQDPRDDEADDEDRRNA